MPREIFMRILPLEGELYAVGYLLFIFSWIGLACIINTSVKSMRQRLLCLLGAFWLAGLTTFMGTELVRGITRGVPVPIERLHDDVVWTIRMQNYAVVQDSQGNAYAVKTEEPLPPSFVMVDGKAVATK